MESNNFFFKKKRTTRSVADVSNLYCSPRKLRLVADLIRNKKVEYSLFILKNLKNKGGDIIYKILLSLIYNWKNENYEKNINNYNLYIEKVLINQGYQLKKIRPAPQGRCNQVRKRYSNIKIILNSKFKNYGT
ncbi:large ribosomal subunit protein uL22 [Candidatus Karelsulcia muelleri]|uniref:large ribosomal subunit protein uL22 n=1 Tax=Candidatus Karelsulcia muelleri TaxID=336810 RepID=UPI0007F9F61B|nr:uL22 family ribosomal protein [Candidatus Karelsulcia muelleri]ANO35797.1 50S ribosomal protein L22 [Candidatus Karelsulcia muelleri]QSF25186.1 50S ribosomal protein L22 [Candidatus Karelsulcia muelleri]WKD87239.1 uL22 family ribosomal protein [Candidatus Karelsulcia muelleri]BEH03671.1 50S ribosomal subunit protein L22 [Candidatus Karelsulcia muelleri]